MPSRGEARALVPLSRLGSRQGAQLRVADDPPSRPSIGYAALVPSRCRVVPVVSRSEDRAREGLVDKNLSETIFAI